MSFSQKIVHLLVKNFDKSHRKFNFRLFNISIDFMYKNPWEIQGIEIDIDNEIEFL